MRHPTRGDLCFGRAHDRFGLGNAALLCEPARRFRQAEPHPPDRDRANGVEQNDPAPARQTERREGNK